MRNNLFPAVIFHLSACDASETVDTVWRGWNKYQIPVYGDRGKLVCYGQEFITNSSYYLGPKGTVAQFINGMNCQNCHVDGGTILFGNNFGKVYATYLQFRARNNGMQSIYSRVNDCLERCLNGKAMLSSIHGMQAIHSYTKWRGDVAPKAMIIGGTSIMKIMYLDEATDPVSGKTVYSNTCQSCHGSNGQGLSINQGTGYTYPPLWGKQGYYDGAGPYRQSSFAGFVKNNMPFGTDYHDPKLTDKGAWNVAAFVNSQPRPHEDQQADWKNIIKKPIDFPFGPGTFPEQQHKHVPFKPIYNFQKSIK